MCRLSGNGDGTFAPKTQYAVPGAGSVAVGDFNGDGRPDLVTVVNGLNAVSVLLNTTDVSAPTIVIAAPGDGASYARGQSVTASYSCQDNAGGSGVMSCSGPVASGAPLDTSKAGTHSFTVTTSDIAGNTASKTVHYTVTAPTVGPTGGPPSTGTPPDKTAPGVSGYGLTNNPFAVGGAKTPTFGSAAAKKHKQGTTLRYTLSEAATVKIAITQRVSGRRKGKQCVAPTRKLRKAKTCTRTIVRGTLTRTSHQGANQVAFSGRIGSRALKPGRYQATITATDLARNASSAKTIPFTIVKR